MEMSEAAAPVGQSDGSSGTVRLVKRITQGVTSAELARAKQLGFQGYLDYQLDYTRIDDSAAETFVAQHFPSLAQPTSENFKIPQATLLQTLQEGTIYRFAFSKRQLFERMVEFWSDHFNIGFEKVGVNKVEDDREVIRKHALGNFGDLLRASSRSVAMLGSLDQYLSVAGSPNQNYARELMELHTVGVDGGYSQKDVAELSRILTGWTFERQWGGGFLFDPAIHDWNAKRVLDLSIAATTPAAGIRGIEEGNRAIELLLAHPNTARFVATKLLKWLLTPAPSEAQIIAVAGVFTKTQGDIKSVVRATLNEDWLREAPPKFKRPAHYVASALRALAPAVNGMATANAYLSDMGHELFMWDTPDGYPDALEYWAGNLLPRWRMANDIVMQRSSTGLDVDVSAYMSGTAESAVERMDRELFGGELPSTTKAALLAYVGTGTIDDTRVRETLGLALASPAFAWY